MTQLPDDPADDVPRDPHRSARRPLVGRRSLILGTGAVATGGAAWWLWPRDPEPYPLHSVSVGLASPSERRMAERADELVPGTRVLRSATDRAALLRQERQWLARTQQWTDGTGEWASLARSSLQDLWVLSADLPASVAGWTPHWRYTWPRDAAHVAVALAVCGVHDGAQRQIDFLAGVPQRDDGWMEARYTDKGGVPDQRAPQADGVGWLLWAVGRLDQLRGFPRGGLDRHRAVVGETVRTALDLFGGGDRLPPASPDYWEVDEHTVTLGVVAPLLAGMTQVTPYVRRALPELSGDLRKALPRIRSRVEQTFGATGYQRYVGRGGADTGVAFLGPAYVPEPLAGVEAAIAAAPSRLRQPAGGLTPGESWKDDGVSWTPETAAFALAQARRPATGAWSDAPSLLRWVASSRTDAGSLPEKVNVDGSGGSACPLAWTAALALLAIDELRGDGSSP